MAGKLIVLEGTDGCGKSTQFARLREHLEERGVAFQCLKFPQYEEESSALIRMYLGGEFGSHPGDVNGYAASAFYAVDRYASYKKVWGKWYQEGGLVLADRYTTSNAIHQASKVAPEEREDFFRWLYDFEYQKLGAAPAGPGVLPGRAHRGHRQPAALPGGADPHPGRHPRTGYRLSAHLSGERSPGGPGAGLESDSMCSEWGHALH